MPRIPIEEKEAAAAKLKEKLGLTSQRNESYTPDHPFVESYKILEKIMEFLSDVNNEAFTQLDKGGMKDPFIDETKQFAEAIEFAEKPFANLEERLANAGIFRQVKHVEKVFVDGKETEIETTTEEPITFSVRPLKNYAKECMRKRHPVNRKRVEEFIHLAQAARGGEFLQRSPPGQNQGIGNDLSGRRLV